MREAGPLVFLEAHIGVVPLRHVLQWHGRQIDAASKVVPPDVAATMKLDPEDTVADTVGHVALDIGVGYKDGLARLPARDDWPNVAAVLKRELSSLRSKEARP